MPVSTSVHLSHCLNHIIHLNPRSVLDVGCGFGMWGFLCRTYLDAFNERVYPKDWQVRIDGIEYFEPYILDHQRALYDSIQIGDIRDLMHGVEPHELVICGDVIEHLEKADGQRVLDVLYSKATRALMLNIPLGAGWDHPEVHGNPAELHRSQWEPEDFMRFPGTVEMFDFAYAGRYACLFAAKDIAPGQRCRALANYAAYLDKDGDAETAIRYLKEATALLPAHPESVTLLADLLLRTGDVSAGAAVLAEAVERDPRFHFAALMLARIEAVQQHTEAALYRVDALLMQDVAQNMRADAETLRAELLAKLGG